MFPTRLTFLPTEKRTYLDHLIYIQFIKNTLETCLIVLTMVALILVGGGWVLQGYFTSLIAQVALTTSKQSHRNAEIKAANATLQQISAIQKEYMLWTPIIIEVANVIPPHVTLTSMSLDAGKKIYSFTGVADTRDDLLRLQTALESLPSVQTVTIPLSQLTEKENIAFSITASIN